jgi:hypothetical protein
MSAGPPDAGGAIIPQRIITPGDGCHDANMG